MLLMYGDGVDNRDLFRLGAFYFYSGVARPADPWALLLKRKIMSVFKELHDATGGAGEIEQFDLADAQRFAEFQKEIGWSTLIDDNDKRDDDDYDETGKRSLKAH